jgi:hypothetical protein
MAVLIVLALIVAAGALLFTSQVSAGPTVMGFACLLAILARIQQAGEHYRGVGKPKA